MKIPLPEKTLPAADRGRPREFDEEAVLAAVAQAFWERGYHATSIDDLCQATGLLRGSLYGAFRNKEGMLLAALGHYSEGRIKRLEDSLKADQPPSRDVLREALLYYARTPTDLNRARACFLTNTALEMVPKDREVAQLIERIFRRMACLLAASFVRAQATGLFHSRLDVRAVGNFLLCLTQGQRIVGKVSSEEELTQVVDLALRALE